ncbi:MAG: rhodanese-like domain-containing protein [Chloroflexota bacterium]|nr:rhodanese-like domain-containing protein [Chloroflexota bacterium]
MAKTFRQMVDEARAEVPTISPDEAQRRVQADPNTLVVGVREPSGIEENGGIPGARNVPLGILPIAADQELPENLRDPELQDRSRPVITTCALGGQAALAAKTLKDMGFENVSILEGGLKGWSEAGLPTEMPKS